MPQEYFVASNRLIALPQGGSELAWLMVSNYTYRTLNVMGPSVLHMETQLKLLCFSYHSLFGRDLPLENHIIAKNISELLYRNNASSGSNLVKLAAVPHPITGDAELFMFYEGPLIYPGYSIWHKPAATVSLTYEVPFPAFKTAANLLGHKFSKEHAAAKGYTDAVTVNYNGDAVSLGENPLFAIQGKNVFVPDAETSSPQSVERLIGMEICDTAGLIVTENCLPASSLTEMDELFSFTPQGILPIGRVNKKLYPPTLAKSFKGYLLRLTSKEFL